MHPIVNGRPPFLGGAGQAIEQRFDQRVPKNPPWSTARSLRVLFALELLKHELGAPMRISAIACGPTLPSWMPVASKTIRSISQDHFVFPETLCEFRSRIDETLLDELIAIKRQRDGRRAGQPAHLVIDTFPCEQGSQRVTDATTL